MAGTAEFDFEDDPGVAYPGNVADAGFVAGLDAKSYPFAWAAARFARGCDAAREAAAMSNPLAGVVAGGVVCDAAATVIPDDGPATPPAVEAIALGVADSLGGAGYVVVGPLPANISGEGRLPKLNSFHFGIALLQPAELTITAAQLATSNRCLNIVRLCILAASTEVFFCASSVRIGICFRTTE